jgi:hypothetical protein
MHSKKNERVEAILLLGLSILFTAVYTYWQGGWFFTSVRSQLEMGLLDLFLK